MINNYEFQLKKLNCCFNRDMENSLEIAQRLSYIKNKELFKTEYKTFNEFCKKAFKNPIPRSTMSEYTSVVYQFCKEDEFSNTGYCVKSLFKNYSYSQLRKMLRLTDEEIKMLQINSDLSVREIAKIVRDYKKHLSGLSDLPDKEEIKEELEDNYTKFNLEQFSFKFYDCDKCLIGNYKTPTSLSIGLINLKEQIIKDNENVYIVLKVPKDKL